MSTGKKYVLNVAWGEQAEILFEEHGFEHTWNNAENLGVSVNTYIFNTQQEAEAFTLGIEQTIGWNGYAYHIIGEVNVTEKAELPSQPKGLSYPQYLFSCLLRGYDAEFTRLEYDRQYDAIPKMYAEFEQSEYNDELTGLYECIIRFLRKKYNID